MCVCFCCCCCRCCCCNKKKVYHEKKKSLFNKSGAWFSHEGTYHQNVRILDLLYGYSYRAKTENENKSVVLRQLKIFSRTKTLSITPLLSVWHCGPNSGFDWGGGGGGIDAPSRLL